MPSTKENIKFTYRDLNTHKEVDKMIPVTLKFSPNYEAAEEGKGQVEHSVLEAVRRAGKNPKSSLSVSIARYFQGSPLVKKIRIEYEF